MAYSVDNPPAKISDTIGGTFNLWVYKSGDAATVVRVNGYITNGYDLGMRAGDLVLAVNTAATPIATQMMIVSAATAASVDLSNGTAITATNTD